MRTDEMLRVEALAGALRAEIERLRAALENVALLDEADGHELTADHARQAVAIATSTLGKHPSEIHAKRHAYEQSQNKSEA